MIGAFAIGARGFAAAVAFAALALESSAVAEAAPPIPAGVGVRVLQPSTMSPRARRCLTRLREELAAGGIQVTVGEFGAGGEALWMVDPPSSREGSIATMTLIGDPDAGAAELWIVNGVPWGRAVVRRLLLPAGAGTHDDEVLAIRALEFLRASALELAGDASNPSSPSSSSSSSSLSSSPSSSPSPIPSSIPSPSAAQPRPTSNSPSVPATTPAAIATEATRPSAPPVAPATRGQVSFELGVSLLESSRTLGPALLPIARLRAEWLTLLETRVTVAGFGTRPRFTGEQGTASVGHMLGLVELRGAFRHGHVVRPAIGLGGGVLRVNVEGEALAPYEGRSGERWVGLFDVGAGLTVRLGRLMSIAVELHGQLAAPYPTVRFSREEVARIGRPALFASVTLVTLL
jgi:hypothetical protein